MASNRAFMERLGYTFRALRSRNFMLYYIGQGVSLIGTWMQRMAMWWLVYRLTGSTLLLATVEFMGQIATFLLTPLAGVVADRCNRRRLIIMCQITATVQASILAALALTGIVRIWHLMLLGVVMGVVNAFDMPARQSFLLEMVGKKEDLSNAIALQSTMVNGSRLIGPAVGGFIVSWLGEGVCFIINALSFGAVIIALFKMKIAFPGKRDDGTRFFRGFREGVQYVFRHSLIRNILLLLCLASLTGMTYMIIMPSYVKDILKSGPRTMGYLMAAGGLGAITGAVYLTLRKTQAGLERIISYASILFGTGLVALSFARQFSLAFVFIMLVGIGMMLQTVSSNTILQIMSENSKRGRVMGFYTFSFIGLAPFGSLLSGFLAHQYGVHGAFLCIGISCLAGGVLFNAWLSMGRRMKVSGESRETGPDMVFSEPAGMPED
ncbi:MAG: MFS transporter [Bacillota bacterium]